MIGIQRLLDHYIRAPLSDRDKISLYGSFYHVIAYGLLLFLCALFLDTYDIGFVRQWPAWFQTSMNVITRLGVSTYIFIASVVVFLYAFTLRKKTLSQKTLLYERRNFYAFLLGGAFFIILVNIEAGVVVQLLKHTIGRARPSLMDEFGAFHFVPFAFRSGFDSFPSGHTITAFATAKAFVLLMPYEKRVHWLMYGLAVAVAFSRVMLFAHHPSDVVMGGILGILSSLHVAHILSMHDILFRKACGYSVMPQNRNTNMR